MSDANPTSTSKRVYEIIIRFPIEEKLINFNILITKLDFAQVTKNSVFDGEKVPEAVKNPMKLSKQRKPSRLELEVNELSILPDKLLKVTPQSKVLCKVKNPVSPSEIWVQDIADAEGCYDK